MKHAHTKSYVRPLSKGGFNCQGVPLGLVNYMNLNRSQCMPSTPVEHMDLETGTLVPVVWELLALTPPRPNFGTKGFFTMYLDSWQRY